MTLHYETLGPAGAPTVLLSAGLGGLGAHWKPQLDILARNHRVILYDQRGTGANATPLPDPYAIEDMANDVAEILAASNTERCHFVGHALGGLVGLALARRDPARLASLTVVNGWARLDSHTARCFAVRRTLLAHGGAAAYAQAQPIFLYPAAWLSANPDRIAAEEAHGVANFQGEPTLLARIAALQTFDIADRLADIAAPTLILAARDDVLVPFTCSQFLVEKIPNATLTLLHEAGHACNITEPAAFNHTLLDFLQTHS